MCVFYSLKYLYSGGIILNITKRYKEISKRLEISETNLRDKIKFLIESGLIKKEDGNLTFISFNKLQKKYKLNCYKHYKLEYANPKKLEILIKSFIVVENLEKQRYKVQQKIINIELRKFGKIQAKSTVRKLRKRIKANIGYLTEIHLKREYSNSIFDFNKKEKKPINGQITISRQNVSTIINRKCKSTGSRLIKKFNSLGILLEDKKDIQLIHRNVDYACLKYLGLNSSFFIYKDNLYKRYCNILSFTKFFA